jgi:hypothetical protein
MSDRVALEKLDIDLTRSREEAASLGDHLLTYVISMAILQVRKKKARLDESAEAKPSGLRLVAA